MSNGPRIVLERRNPEEHDSYNYISAYKFYNPIKDDIWNNIVIGAPEKSIDGKYLILLVANSAQVRIESVHDVIGIVENRGDVDKRTYELAKKLAEERAKKETYGWYNEKSGVPFVDETDRAKEGALASAI